MGHVDWSSSRVGGECRVGAAGQQETHHLHVVVLHGVMQRSETGATQTDSESVSMQMIVLSITHISYCSDNYIITFYKSHLIHQNLLQWAEVSLETVLSI